MKRGIFKKILACAVSAVCVLACSAFVACGGGGEEEEPATPEYTVSFDMQGHGTQVPAQSVKEGGYAAKPENPAAEGYTFGGWFKEAGCTNEFAFSSEKITGNVTVYAKWTANPAQGGDEEPAPSDTSVKLTGKIYLVGDSTVCSFSDNYYYPRYGYGTQLHNYINCDETQIVNLAISGRSSKSFLTESNYNTLKTSIAEGDYLIIGFGHNDEKSAEEARFTDPNPDYQTPTSSKGDGFQYTLYQNYVKVAKDAGATPILCTPIVRYDSAGTYTGSKVHVTSDGDYPQAIRDLGEDTNTTVIDLTALTMALYKADNEEAAKFHAYTTYASETDKTPTGRDDTHINLYGAKAVAYQFAQAMLKTDCPLKNNIITNAAAPGQADYEAAKKADYVKPSYNAFDPANTTAKSLGDGWFATAMGNLGGDSKVSSFTISKTGDAFTVGVDSNNGKFESKSDGSAGSDGFAAAFMQIKKQDNFTATATVTVKTKGSAVSGQSGFGIMLRDNILINKNDATENNNYVAAGVLGASGTTIFSRKDGSGAITSNRKGTATVEANSTFALEFTRTGQSITCKVGDLEFNETDFDFFAVDGENMYLCLFATRGYIVEFTNVNVQVQQGEAQDA